MEHAQTAPQLGEIVEQVQFLSIGSNMGSDPPKSQVGDEQKLEIDEQARTERRLLICKKLEGKGKMRRFKGLLADLTLLQDYEAGYEDSAKDAFLAIAKAAPFISNGKLKLTYYKDSGSFKQFFKPSTREGPEKSLARYFGLLYKQMGIVATSAPDSVPLSVYKFADLQIKRLDDTPLMPDGAFLPLYCFPSEFGAFLVIFEAKAASQERLISGDILGQIGDYIRKVWETQFTRTFIPAIFLSGSIVWLLIFTRDQWFQCRLGQICHDKEVIEDSDAKEVSNTFAQLWFILTRPSHQLGHFCEMAELSYKIKFQRTSSKNVLSTAAFVSGGDCSFDLGNPIPRRISFFGGRMSRLFRDRNYSKDKVSRPAVLKLAWTPTDRLPEGLIYEYLQGMEAEAKKRTPEVYESGIICENVFGYRVEYLIMEDCGHSLIDHVTKQAKIGIGRDAICGILLDWMKEAISIIGYMYVHNVLHRDVSANNLTIDDNDMLRIVDLGLAKIKKEELILQKDLVKRWLLANVENIATNEEIHDRLTGTPLYSGIRILAGAKKRGLIDDIESIWCDILHLWAIYEKGIEKTISLRAYMYHTTDSFAVLRAGCVSDFDEYLYSFGAGDMPRCELRTFLNKLHNVLFLDDGMFIGLKMVHRPDDYLRDYHAEEVSWLFEKELRQALGEVDLGDSCPSKVKGKRKETLGHYAQAETLTQRGNIGTSALLAEGLEDSSFFGGHESFEDPFIVNPLASSSAPKVPPITQFGGGNMYLQQIIEQQQQVINRLLSQQPQGLVRQLVPNEDSKMQGEHYRFVEAGASAIPQPEIRQEQRQRNAPKQESKRQKLVKKVRSIADNLRR